MTLDSRLTLALGWLVWSALSACDTDQQLGKLSAAGAGAGGESASAQTSLTGGQANTTLGQGGESARGGAMATTAATSNPTPVLCDGSSDIRLGLTSGGGMVEPGYFFAHAYGYWFVFIDGLCHYWIGKESGEVREGSLSAAEATGIEEQLQLTQLARFVGRDETCPDAGSTSIMYSTYLVECSCGCDTEEKKQLFERLVTVRNELFRTGIERDWDLFAARTDYITSSKSVPWPLTWPASNLPLATYANIEDLVGLPITDVDDRQQLRTLRASYNTDVPGVDVITLSQDPEPMGLLLAERLPDATRERIDRFLALAR